MDRCELFQALLLEHLYDLLDSQERQSLEAHLTGCTGCQTALERAKKQQQLLAKAAKAEFAAVRFQAPAASEAAPATIPLRVRKARPILRRLAMAAAVFLAIGIGGTGIWVGNDYAAAKREVGQHQVALADLEKERTLVQQQIANVPAEQANKFQEVQRKINEQQIRLEVVGPKTIQPGAPNEYHVAARDFNGQPAATRLLAKIVDQNNTEVFKKEFAEPAADRRIELPADLPVQPNKQLRLEVLARKADGPQIQLTQQLDLLAPVYVTHLATDKPMYQPGESVRFRSLTLERFSLKPPVETLNLVYTLVQPSGAQVQLGQGAALVNNSQNVPILGPDQKPVRGIGAGEFFIDPSLPGGEYTLRVSELTSRFPPQERKFIVNQYQAHKLDKKLDFSKKSYGPGEDVSAACEAKRAGGGGEVANRPVHASVKIDGVQYGPDGKPSNQPFHFQTDAQGKVAVRFKLPSAIQTGLGTVSVTFDDGANTETLVKPIPIVLKKLDVQFFPEGGDLVAGLENRVYFEVRNPLGKPADLKGHIVDADKKTIVDKVETLTDGEQPGVNQGLGVFAFTPRVGGKYELKIDSPGGMEGMYALPSVVDDGVVLTIARGVTNAKEPITAAVRSAQADRKLLVGAYCRGRLLDHKTVAVRKGEEAMLELNPAVGAGGVYRVTVFEEIGGEQNRHLVPRAERLVYRQPGEHLLITAKPDKHVYVPGDKVTLSFDALNEQEKAAPAILMVSVVDKSIVTMADEKTHRAMPTHFLLTSEVNKPEDLEYADFLIGSHPKAKEALDLLLGTQGWRRFKEQAPARFRQMQAEDADNLLVKVSESQRPQDLEQKQFQIVREEIAAKQTRLEGELRQANEQLQSMRNDAAFLALRDKLQNYDSWIRTARDGAIPVLCLVFVIVAITALIAGLLRKRSRAIPLYLTAAACGVMAYVLFLNYSAVFQGRSQTASDLSKVDDSVAANKDRAPTREMLRERPRAAPPEMVEALKANKAEAPPQAFHMAPEGREAMDGGRVAPDRDLKEAEAVNLQDRALAVPEAAMKLDKAAKPLPDDKPKDGKDVNALRRNANGPKGDARAAGRPVAPMEAAKAAGAGGMQAGFGGGMQGGFGGGPVAGGAMPTAPPLAGMAAPAANKPMGIEQKFRGLGYLGEAQADRMGARRKMPAQQQAIVLPPLMVREYAHTRAHGVQTELRNDRTETVYWNPVFVLAGRKGEVTFDLSDQVTSFEVTAYAHTLDGRLGTLTSTIESRIPLALEAKTPIEVTANDKIDIPLAIANNTNAARAVEIEAAFNGLTLLSGKANDQLQVAADGRTRRIYRLQPSIVEGNAELLFRGRSQGVRPDDVPRTLRVVPDGFPIVASKSDLLEKSATNEIVLPETWIKGTLKAGVAVYPSTLADLQKGLDALLREPNGCFEQTSTSNYPNLLILDYLKESDQTKPDVEKRARDLLVRGYQKLIAFECPKTADKNRQGFEWFGSPDQQHEALTAYGLLQFRDLSRVMDVDPSLIQRTRNYLMSARNGKGGFKRNPAAIDSFGRAPENITNAYIVWAITSSGKDDDVTTELNALRGQAKESKDPYFLALVANSLINRGQTADAMELLNKLAAAQQADGHLDAQQTSITGSAGRDLQIETTALAVLAWLKGNPGEFNPQLRKAIAWIGQQRGGFGGFGSTQSTILALKALIEYTKANKKTPEGGTLMLFVGDKLLGKLDFPADTREALEIKLPNAEEVLKPGKNTVRVEITGQNVFPYTLTWSYQTLQPASDPDCPVHLTTKLDRPKANEGETVTLNVTVENPSNDERSMVVAIVGLPAGLTLPEDMKQLKEHARLRDDGKKPGLISYFETRGRELILYWRGMGPKQKIEVPVELICRVPGEYRGPASRAYMYYNADHKHWVEPLAVTIAAQRE